MRSSYRVYSFEFIVVLATTLFLLSCSVDKKKQTKAEQPVRAIEVPEFNADSAYAFVQKQVDFGPRVPNTATHRACKEYLISALKRYGWSVQLQDFQEKAYTGEILALTNIIASVDPEKKKRILLAAHWDTRPFADKDTDRTQEPIDGANDGGSGVGVLLELARVIQNQQPEVGIDIILFDGEDFGVAEFDKNERESSKIWYCLGSQYWAKNKHQANYTAYYGILLDMVGAKNALFYQEGESMHYAPSVVKKVWSAASNLGYGHYFVNRSSPGIIDDHVFVNRDGKIPMIDIIEFDPIGGDSYFPSYHHTHKDNMDIIDRSTLAAVGETLLKVIFEEQ